MRRTITAFLFLVGSEERGRVDAVSLFIALLVSSDDAENSRTILDLTLLVLLLVSGDDAEFLGTILSLTLGLDITTVEDSLVATRRCPVSLLVDVSPHVHGVWMLVEDGRRAEGATKKWHTGSGAGAAMAPETRAAARRV